jgi:hypothetical protein
MGDPAQQIDLDLDMLTSDWFVFSSTSPKGSFFLDCSSKTYGKISYVCDDYMIC